MRSEPRRVAIVAARAGRRVATAAVADTSATRLRGLLGRKSLAEGDGLVLSPCNSIHTWFMRFAIDVVFLDRAGVVLRSVRALPPFRLAWGGWRARTTLELPAGTLDTIPLPPGEPIRIEPA